MWIWLFGWNQHLTPHIIQGHLRYGDSLDRVAFALGSDVDVRQLMGSATRDTAGSRRIAVSEPGGISYIVPQHEIVLLFDVTDSLTGAWVHYSYGLSEIGAPIRLADMDGPGGRP